MEIIEIESVGSTNAWMCEHAKTETGDCLVFAREQTAGRGQRGNTWESEPGKNLTASLLLHPKGIEPARQFTVSEAVALAVVDLLAEIGLEALVKWPNDIYVEGRKICGILIEHSIMGRSILHTIAGVGINVNQEIFRSDAPNPVSVFRLTGKTLEIRHLAERLASLVGERLSEGEACPDNLHSRFLSNLWRGDGKFYPFIDKNEAKAFEARVHSIAPDGILTLEDKGGELRRYAFKEVEFVLEAD